MPFRDRMTERLVVAFLVSALLFHADTVSTFTSEAILFIAGVPFLYIYLFGVWAVLIAVVALIVELDPEKASGAPQIGDRYQDRPPL